MHARQKGGCCVPTAMEAHMYPMYPASQCGCSVPILSAIRPNAGMHGSRLILGLRRPRSGHRIASCHRFLNPELRAAFDSDCALDSQSFWEAAECKDAGRRAQGAGRSVHTLPPGPPPAVAKRLTWTSGVGRSRSADRSFISPFESGPGLGESISKVPLSNLSQKGGCLFALADGASL